MTQTVDFNAFDPFAISNAAEEGSSGGDTRFITKIPGPQQPLIVKFMPTPDQKAFVPMNYYQYRVGPQEKDVRLRPSLTSLGVVEEDPENNKKWEYIKQMSEMKKNGVSKDSAKYKAVFEAKKLYEPKKQGWAYVIEPGSNQVKCLKLNTAMINILFGREGDGQKIKTIPSLLEMLKKRGKSPYDRSQEDCWLKIWKTGEGIATEYFIEPAQTVEVRIIDGAEVEMKKFESFPVAEVFKKNIVDVSSWPNPLKFEEKSAFSLEETIEFINTDGVVFPERFAPKKKSHGGDSNDSTPVSSETYAAASGSMDDIPF